MKRILTEQPILCIASAGYLLAFVAFGLSSDRSQISFYAVFMVVAFALVVMTYSHFRLRPITLWGLTIWGFAHMAGGLLSIGGDVLYRFDLVPGVLRFDQVVHAFGFGFATAACWDVLGEVIMHGRAVAHSVLALLGGLGFGAINEAIEFLVTRIDPSSNVGGFVNTGFDLLFNTLGCALAATLLYLADPSRRSGHRTQRP
ncbi:MAG: hypothetical protein ACR2MC_04375 [Actinomycetota bacterium]